MGKVLGFYWPSVRYTLALVILNGAEWGSMLGFIFVADCLSIHRRSYHQHSDPIDKSEDLSMGITGGGGGGHCVGDTSACGQYCQSVSSVYSVV